MTALDRMIAAVPMLPEVIGALVKCENYIANTEGELGIELDCGKTSRAILAKLETNP